MVQTTGSRTRRWPDVFFQPRFPCRRQYNTSFIQHLRKAFEVTDEEDNSDTARDLDVPGTAAEPVVPETPVQPGDAETEDDDRSDNEEQQDEPDEPIKKIDKSLPRVFMRGRLHEDAHEVHDNNRHQAREVETFCEGITFRDLEDGSRETKGKPNILLHERSTSGEVRENCGPMRWRQLHGALQTKRFGPDGDTTLSVCDGKDSQQPKKHRPDADQRRLYIHNLTPLDAAVLMSNASYHEAKAMRGMLHNHIAGNSEISVTIPPHRLTYTMRVCLSYHTLFSRRRSQFPLVGIKVPALHSTDEEEDLYNAKTTIQIDGCDNQTYTMICLVDSPDPHDGVRQYYENPSDISDPVTMGRTLLDLPITDPRLYFLSAWAERIAQVAAELDNVVNSFRNIARRNWERIARNVDQPESWVDAAKQLTELACRCNLVKTNLSKMVNDWKKFQMGDVDYFKEDDDLPLTARMDDLLRNITSSYGDLESCQSTLETLKADLGHSTPNNMLAVQGHTVSRQIEELTQQLVSLSLTQQRSGEEVHRLTYTGMMFLPLMFTSGVFSAAPAALPFSPSLPIVGFSLLMVVILVYYLDFLSIFLPSLAQSKERFTQRPREVLQHCAHWFRLRGQSSDDLGDDGPALPS